MNPTPSRTRILAPAAALLVTLLAAPARAAVQEDAFEVRPFSIPDTQTVRALHERAEEHIGARRFSDAIFDLQTILDDHDGDVLAESRPRRGGRTSQRPVHRGAVEYARRRLAGLPEAAREVYGERYGGKARAALAAAVASNDRNALVRVAVRWPITQAAERAWWALGDLELEIGNVREAVHAWQRALTVRTSSVQLELRDAADWSALRDELPDDAATAGVRARIDLVLAALGTGGRTVAVGGANRSAQMHLPGPREATGIPPGTGADSWAQPRELPDDHPFYRSDPVQLHPVLADDAVLVSTSLQVMSVNAFTGKLNWITPEPRGWSRLAPSRRREFFGAVDSRMSLIAPAAAGGIAVAALQIPITHIHTETFRQIQITRVIPDRRLFAFDLDSGAPLWDHMPPLSWDGESGSFPDRMSVGGPPVIAGSRLLAPYYRMRGRIDYHVACFDLATGERLWSTDLISGQRELNMFGRHQKEFCSAPLRIEGDRVIALTQLGSMAALDLFSGEILWECLYDQIPLPKNRQWEATPRRVYWQNTQPVVADGVVVATPIDSEDLLGVDLETGAVLWSLPNGGINAKTGSRGRTSIDLLVGADENTVYLGGAKIAALRAPAGLAHGEPIEVAWVFADDDLLSARHPPRPVLGRDAIVLVTDDVRVDLERHTGRYLSFPRELRGRNTAGNLLLGDGLLFTLNSRRLNGYFEWDVLLSRARERLATAPNDRALALSLGRLLGQRGRSEAERGYTAEAVAHLLEARKVLEPLVTGSDDVDPELAAELHGCLVAEARARADLAQTPTALQLLRRARPLAPDRDELLYTLLEEEALLDRGDDAERLALLEELERRSGDLVIDCAWIEREDRLGSHGELRPILDEREPEPDVPRFTMPVGLWVALERSGAAGRRGDYRQEYEDLHRVLYAYPDVRLPGGPAYEVASARIARRLRLNGDRGYEPFEERAVTLLEEALGTRDRDRLSEVPRYFPHTEAARRANDTLLDWAVESADIAAIAGIVQSEIGAPWRIGDASERDAQLLLRLADAVRRQENVLLYEAMVRALAAHYPTLVSGVPAHEGRSVRELLDTLPTALPEQREPLTFTEAGGGAQELSGRFEFLGDVAPGSEGGERVLVFVEEETLVAFGPGVPDEPAWRFALEGRSAPSYWTDRFASTDGIPLVAARDRVLALDRELGSIAWQWEAGDDEVESVTADAGLAVAVVNTSDGRHDLVALETRTGTLLWRERVEATLFDPLPVVGSGKVVLLPRFGEQEIAVRDLFTGRRARTIPYPWLPQRTIHEGSWIEGGKLIVPRFREADMPERNHVLAYDLETGREAWRLSLNDEAQRQLDAVVHHGEESYLVLRPGPRSASGGEHPGYMVQLHADIGAKRRVGRFELAREDKLLGILPKRRTQVADPWLFVRSRAGGNQTLVRAIHLPHGERWVYRLPVGYDDLYPINQPALSGTTVALGYTKYAERQRMSNRTTLIFLSRAGGAPLDSRILHQDLNVSDDVHLFALGNALLVQGKKRIDVFVEKER